MVGLFRLLQDAALLYLDVGSHFKITITVLFCLPQPGNAWRGCVNTLREGELAKKRRQSPAAKPAGEERQPPAIKKLARVQPLSEPLKPRQTRVRATVGPPQAHTSATLGQ